MTSDEEVEEFLAHFGIKGMRWGVRKDKTVSVGRQAKREKKALKFDTKAEVLKLKIKDVDAQLAKNTWSWQKRRLNEDRAKLSKEHERAESDAAAKRAGKLSSGQKKAIKGAAAAAAIIAAYATYQTIQSGNGRRQIEKGKAFVDARRGRTGPRWKLKPDLAKADMNGDEIMSNVVRHINPGYGDTGTKVNCRRATFAYEMRRRGYDVAATKTTNGRGQNAAGMYNALVVKPGEKPIRSGPLSLLKRIGKENLAKEANAAAQTPLADLGRIGRQPIEQFKGPGGIPLTRPTKIFEALSKQPNGARGELGMIWNGGGGHSMAWEIVGGKPMIIDTQRGKRYSDAMDFMKEFDITSIHEAGFTRLDNVPLNEDFLLRWVKNAG